MAEYISREAFAAEMKSRQDAAEKWLIEATGTEDAYGKARAEAILSFLCEVKLTLDAIPAADVREVVLCKFCRSQRWCNFAQYLGNDGYCSRGEYATNCGADMREVEHGS